MLHSDCGHPGRAVGDRRGQQEQWEPGRQTSALTPSCWRVNTGRNALRDAGVFRGLFLREGCLNELESRSGHLHSVLLSVGTKQPASMFLKYSWVQEHEQELLERRAERDV